jgi:hypothetical protein
MGKIVISENVSLDGVVEDPSRDEGFARGGWVGRVTDRPAVGKSALGEALRAEAFLLGAIVVPGSIQLVRTLMEHHPVDELRLLVYPVRSVYLRVLGGALAIPRRPAGGQPERPAQGRRLLDPRESRVEQLDGAEGRRGEGDLEAEGGARRRASSARAATGSPCGSLAPTPVTASPSSPTSPSETHSGHQTAPAFRTSAQPRSGGPRLLGSLPLPAIRACPGRRPALALDDLQEPVQAGK